MARNDNLRRSQQPAAPPPSQGKSRKPRRWLRRLFGWGFALVLLAVAVVAVAVGLTVKSLPSFDELKNTQVGEQMIVMRARDGTELVTLGPSYGKWLSYAQIPAIMRDAMVSVEDKRFRSHIGVDPIGIARSIFVRYQSGRFKQGASTITQQLARNIFLNNDRTLTRKLREAVLAMAIDWKFSKNQILELYLNKVYFGGGAYGVDSASRKFFGHAGTQISLPEAAIIAGLVKAPSRFSPTCRVQTLKRWRRLSLRHWNAPSRPSRALR